jgi:hypothetical protein
MMQSADIIGVPDEMAAYFVTMGARPVATHDDVDEFLSAVRRVLRRWEQADGLHAAWMVSEVTVKDGHTEMDCPVCTAPPQVEEWPREVAEVVQAVHRGRGIEGRCHVCDGVRKLPKVHLHVHLIVIAAPFSWGVGVQPGMWAFPGDLGLRAVIREEGLEHLDVELLRDVHDAKRYLSKVAKMYLSKAAKTTVAGPSWWTGEGNAQRTAEVASLVYGRRRSRGTYAAAYGLRVHRTAGELPTVDPLQVWGELGSAAELLFVGYRTEAEQRSERRAHEASAREAFDQPSEYAKLLAGETPVAPASALVVSGTVRVLSDTQVAGPAAPTAGRAEALPPLGPPAATGVPRDGEGSRGLGAWRDLPCVRCGEGDWWALRGTGAAWIGRGRTVMRVEPHTLEESFEGALDAWRAGEVQWWSNIAWAAVGPTGGRYGVDEEQEVER